MAYFPCRKIFWFLNSFRHLHHCSTWPSLCHNSKKRKELVNIIISIGLCYSDCNADQLKVPVLCIFSSISFQKLSNTSQLFFCGIHWFHGGSNSSLLLQVYAYSWFVLLALVIIFKVISAPPSSGSLLHVLDFYIMQSDEYSNYGSPTCLTTWHILNFPGFYYQSESISKFPACSSSVPRATFCVSYYWCDCCDCEISSYNRWCIRCSSRTYPHWVGSALCKYHLHPLYWGCHY